MSTRLNPFISPNPALRPLQFPNPILEQVFSWKASFDGQVAHTHWTPYESYSSDLSGYIIQRKSGDGEFIDVASVGAGTTSWQESIESVINGFQPGEVQYKVLALSNQVEGTDTRNQCFQYCECICGDQHAGTKCIYTRQSKQLTYSNPLLTLLPASTQMIIYDREEGNSLKPVIPPRDGMAPLAGVILPWKEYTFISFNTPTIQGFQEPFRVMLRLSIPLSIKKPSGYSQTFSGIISFAYNGD